MIDMKSTKEFQFTRSGKTSSSFRSFLLRSFKVIGLYCLARMAEQVITLLSLSDRTRYLLFIPGLEKIRWNVGKLRMWLQFRRMKKHVPAYRSFCEEITSFPEDQLFHAIPVIDKENYVKRYPIAARCLEGILPMRGVIIDESSGSSGVPSNWARGNRERQLNSQMLSFSLRNLLGNDLFILNAFALGPWATGMNVTMSFSKDFIVKSLGPDKEKILNTLKMFGTGFHYVIMGYPPFLKSLVESDSIELKNYKITLIYGGEAMGLKMRKYILERGISSIYSSFGASDLELNMAAETPFTVKLRELLDARPDIACKILKINGALPMIFQYNPLDFFIESNDQMELIISICRPGYLSPKVRYNIHDKGHVVRIPELFKILQEFGITPEQLGLKSDLPVLFHYGRSDMSVAFYGCKISPSDVQEAIFTLPELASLVHSFAMTTFENERTDKFLCFNLELKEGQSVDEMNVKAPLELIISALKQINQDFRESIRISGDDKIQMKIFAYGKEIFEAQDLRIKRMYIM